MHDENFSRRLFLLHSLGGAGAAWLAAGWPEILAAHEHVHQAAKSGRPPRLEFFAPEQAAEIEAISAQIIPSDQTPGAREARVIYFIDRALSTFDSERKEPYRKGLGELQAAVAQKHPAVKKFSGLGSVEQIEMLKSIEKTEFFEAVRAHTIAGFLANPEYGGNHDQVGWKLIGFENAPAFEPPFGYYDREYTEDQQRQGADRSRKAKEK